MKENVLQISYSIKDNIAKNAYENIIFLFSVSCHVLIHLKYACFYTLANYGKGFVSVGGTAELLSDC